MLRVVASLLGALLRTDCSLWWATEIYSTIVRGGARLFCRLGFDANPRKTSPTSSTYTGKGAQSPTFDEKVSIFY
jgi:hypothetical protein